MKNLWRLFVSFIFILCFIYTLSSSYGCGRKTGDTLTGSLTPVRVVSVTRGDIAESVSLTGDIHVIRGEHFDVRKTGSSP